MLFKHIGWEMTCGFPLKNDSKKRKRIIAIDEKSTGDDVRAFD